FPCTGRQSRLRTRHEQTYFSGDDACPPKSSVSICGVICGLDDHRCSNYQLSQRVFSPLGGLPLRQKPSTIRDLYVLFANFRLRIPHCAPHALATGPNEFLPKNSKARRQVCESSPVDHFTTCPDVDCDVVQ